LRDPPSPSRGRISHRRLGERTREQLDADWKPRRKVLGDAGALDVYVLTGTAASQTDSKLAERAFWITKAAGANENFDIGSALDRARLPEDVSSALADKHGAYSRCGHWVTATCTVRLSTPTTALRKSFCSSFSRGVELAGPVVRANRTGSRQTRRVPHSRDPALVACSVRSKHVFDPTGLLNPYRHLDESATTD